MRWKRIWTRVNDDDDARLSPISSSLHAPDLVWRSPCDHCDLFLVVCSSVACRLLVCPTVMKIGEKKRKPHARDTAEGKVEFQFVSHEPFDVKWVRDAGNTNVLLQMKCTWFFCRDCSLQNIVVLIILHARGHSINRQSLHSTGATWSRRKWSYKFGYRQTFVYLISTVFY